MTLKYYIRGLLTIVYLDRDIVGLITCQEWYIRSPATWAGYNLRCHFSFHGTNISWITVINRLALRQQAFMSLFTDYKYPGSLIVSLVQAAFRPHSDHNWSGYRIFANERVEWLNITQWHIWLWNIYIYYWSRIKSHHVIVIQQFHQGLLIMIRLYN